MAVMVAGEKFMLKVTQLLVYPLVGILAFIIVLPDPRMENGCLASCARSGCILGTVWLTIPVLVFAFNHSPAISQFSVSLKRDPRRQCFSQS